MTTDFGETEGTDEANGVALHNGRIVAAGRSDGNIAVARYHQ